MIISASRRTDLPAFYGGWFMERLRAGYCLVRNPFNPGQVRRVDLTPPAVDCFVFWSKNPAPFLKKLPYLREYPYYFHFTLNPYGRDLEPHLPPKKELVKTFRRLAGICGPERVFWRYDPVILTNRITPEHHYRWFTVLARELAGATGKVVFSFLCMYQKCRRNLRDFAVREPDAAVRQEIARTFAGIARTHGLAVAACAEPLDLTACGVEKGRCVDARLVTVLSGRPVKDGKDRHQRPACGCAPSVDIGAYNTCPHLCRYCYANYSPQAVQKNLTCHVPGGQEIIKHKVHSL